MSTTRILFALTIFLASLAANNSDAFQGRKPPPSGLDRGVNFGNMLEAPSEGDWGLTVQEQYFDLVLEAGLDHIRLPISWTFHADQTAPYTIDESFFQRIDWCIDQAKMRGLKLIVNNHHYDELNVDPLAEWDRALAIWEQIATRYQFEPDTVYFEILNEPHNMFNDVPELWNQFMLEALVVIRTTNPTRQVLVGPTQWNSISAIGTFSPPNDANLVATIHYYDPFEFTHQGAGWINPPPPVGVQWWGNRAALGGTWQNWSWSTTLNPLLRSKFEVTYETGWAGFQVHDDAGIANPTQISFSINKPMSLAIQCRDANGNSPTYNLQTDAGEKTYVISMSEFDDPAVVKEVIIQNYSGDPQPPFILRGLEFTVANKKVPVFSSEGIAVRDALYKARNWGIVNKMPVYLGEFGAYEAGDYQSRVRWTKRVRIFSEYAGIGFGYWELAAGFGIYDPVAEQWRLQLLQALIPEFTN